MFFIIARWPGRWLGMGLLWLLLSSPWLAQGQASPFAVRVTPTGSVGLNVGQQQLLRATAVYPAFLSAGFNGNVLATAVQPDGKVLAGGSFSKYSTTDRHNLARLNADGTLDTSFLTGNELDGDVYAIALQTDGYILIGGNFTTFNGISCLGLARLTPTGALDQTFVTSGATVGFSGGSVRAIAVQSTDDILVGGEFTASGSTAYKYLVALTKAGGFSPNLNATIQGTNAFQDAVLALTVQGNDNILVGGRFLVPRHRIARLNSDGTLDSGFAGSLNSGPATGAISAIAEFGSNILVGGDFAGYTSNGSPTAYNRLALLNGSGSNAGELVASFVPRFSTATSVQVNSLVTLSATSIVVGGQFTEYNAAARKNLVALDPSGNLATSFDVGTGFSTIVNSLTLQPNGNVVAGGQFTTYKDASANYIARLKPNGSADALDVPLTVQPAFTWSTGASKDTILTHITGLYWATATVGGVSRMSNTVAITAAAPTLAPIAVHVVPTAPRTAPLIVTASQLLTATAVYPALQVGTGFSDANTPPYTPYIWEFKTQSNGKLVVGGRFTDYNGKPCRYITRLNADGSRDPSFGPPSTGGIDNVVTVVTIQPNGKIMIGGDFRHYGPNTTLNYLARLNTDGTLDANFDAKSGFSNSPNVIVAQPDGRLLVGGNFPLYINSSGAPTPVYNIVRLKDDGSRDTSFGPASTGGLNGEVYALALQPDGKILVGGNFTYYGSPNTPRQRIARLNDDGTLDPSFNYTGTGLNDIVFTLALQPDGKVLVGGQFTSYLIRLNADGSPDNSFSTPSLASAGAGKAVSVSSLILQSDGNVLVGGDFAGHVARVTTSGSIDPTFALTGTGFNDNVHTLAVQPDGQVLVGGPFTSYNSSTTANRKGLARLNPNGTLNNTDTALPGTATYAWNNGSTGPKLTVAASGSYSVTATFLGQTAISDSVAVRVDNLAPAPFSLPVTPTGPLSLCATGSGSSQILTALVAGTPAAGTSYTYEWWKVLNGGTPTSLGPAGPTNTSYTVSASAPGQYFAIATLVGGPAALKAASATVSVGVASTPTLTNTVTGLPGDNVVLKGTDLDVITGVNFGTLPAAFALSSPTELTATVPAGATSGAISLVTACSTVAYPGTFSLPAPTIVSLSPQVGVPGGSVVLTGTGFIVGATTVTLNGTPISATATSSTQLIATMPTGIIPGSSSLVATTAGGSSNPVPFVVSAAKPTVISTNITLPAGGTYGNLLIVSPAVVTISGGSLTGNIGITVNQLEVQAGATLNLTDATIVAGGRTSSFLLAAGATLNVGHPGGLGGASVPGAIQLSSLFFSPDASYGYSGTQPQATGSNLPSQVRNLTSTNSSRLTLTQPVSVAQVLTMGGAGHFYLNNKSLTLLSNAAGTALVVNKPGAGRVLGTATVQRYINPIANTGTGFRYYGSPVKGATAAVLAAPAFDYDQSRYRPTARQDTLPLISYGFTTSSLVPNTLLEVGRGYRAAVPAATTVQFTGTLTTGDTTITLARTGQAAYNGWNLVSNPYPAPLNWSKLVAAADAAGLDAAIYVYESANTSVGSYRSYVNGVSNDGLLNTSNGDLLIAMGQAFFVRVRKGLASGTLTFRNSHRETSYLQQASFSRTAAATPFKLTAALERNGSGGGGGGCSRCGRNLANRIALYLDAAGATGTSQAFNANLDADASNLFSFSQQTLSIKGAAGVADSTLAIRAIAPPTTLQAVPLVVSATTPGSYSIQVAIEQLNQLAPGLVPYLHDRNPATAADAWHDLRGATAATPLVYSFDLSAVEVLGTTIKVPGTTTNRFEVVFRSVITATASASAGLGSVDVFPNPTQHRIHVVVPAIPGATQVQATLFNGLGQVVLRQSAPLPAAGTALDLEAEKLAGGVYILRLQAGSSIATRRVMLEK